MPPKLSIWAVSRSIALRSPPLSHHPPHLAQPPAKSAFTRYPYSTNARPPSEPPSSSSPRPPPPSPPREWGTLIPKVPDSMLKPGETAPVWEDDQMREYSAHEQAMQQLEMESQGVDPLEVNEYTGYKFEEPPMPLGKLEDAQYHLRHRYAEGIAQFTRLLMRDGKLSKAQNTMAMALTYLRTSPAPKVNPSRPLLPGAPPPEHLPLNPNLYLMLAIDSVAPLIRIRGYTGLAGGGKSLEVPVPLDKRARRRMAWTWLMDAVDKKPSMGSGKKQLAHKIGDEIRAIIEGRSSVWDRRTALHKHGTSVRANMNLPALAKWNR